MSAIPADAGQWGFSKTVTSGSSSFVSAGVSCHHVAGTVSVLQNSSNPTAVGRYRIVNAVSGAATTYRDLSNGNTGSWTGVVQGTHYLEVRRAQPADTNGWWSPGSGNTTFGGVYTCP